MRARKRGFTLMEMVVVITILGVVSLAVFSFIGMGTRIYVDATERDQLLSEARFVVERLSRELRNAVPNSIRTRQANSNNSHCIEFVPIKWSGFYLDVPVAPEPPATEFQAIISNGISDVVDKSEKFWVFVYPISSKEVYNSTTLSRVRYPVSEPDTEGLITINIDNPNPVHFTTDSPSSRFYIGGEPVAYCFWREGGEEDTWLHRYQGYLNDDGEYISSPTNSTTNMELIKDGAESLMAKGVYPYSLVAADDELPFKVLPATLTRNALVQIRLRFMLNEEILSYHYEVQVPNVP